MLRRSGYGDYRHGFKGLPALLAAALFLPGAASGGGAITDLGAGRLAVRVFRDAQGLPQNTVQAIALDGDGFLWIGTQDGAARYDGQSWRTIDMPHRLRSNFVRTILPAPGGAVWFGTHAAGAFRLQDGDWVGLDDLCGRPVGERVNALTGSTGGDGGTTIWAGTYGDGLVRLDSGGCRTFTTADGLPSDRIWALLVEPGGGGEATIWAGTEAGLARLAPGAERFTVEPALAGRSVNSLAVVPEPDGGQTVWAGTYGGGAAQLTDGGWAFLTRRQGLPSNFVTSMAVAPGRGGRATLWIGTDGGGAAHVMAGAVETINMDAGLPSDSVYSLLAAGSAGASDTVWIGTRNGGLAQLVEGEWVRFDPAPAAPSIPVNAILMTRDAPAGHTLWLGTDGGGLARLHRGRWTVFSRASGELPSDIVQCLLETRDARGRRTVWIGTRNGGLVRFRNGRWTRFSMATGALPGDMVQALLETREEDGSRTLWVGTRDGLARMHGETWTSMGTAEGLPNGSVTSLLETREAGGTSTVWIGTDGGLVSLAGERLQVWDTTSGLLNASIQSLAEHRSASGRRTLWIGTDGGGVSVLDLTGGLRILFTLTDASTPAIPNNVVYRILEDRRGRIYLLTNRGVTRLEPAGDGHAPDSLTVFTYTDQDGLPLNEGNRGAGLVDDRGRIWVGTVGGAAVFDPDAERVDAEPKRLVLRTTLAGDPDRELAPGDSLAHDRPHIVFEYSLLSFFRESETRYRTQLAGLDVEPTPWGTDVKKEYRTLGHGSYVFKVWGRDYAGNVTGPVELPFSVRPAPWQTWWAAALLLALLGTAIWGAINLRLRASRRRERKLESLVAARTRRLTEANQLLVHLSYADPLTGVGNRRRFDEALELEWRRATRSATPISLVLLDVDLFKGFNDRFGHLQGDECLKTVAAAIADALPRAGDSVARYGGDEFAVILPRTDQAGAVTVAENLRSAVAEASVQRKLDEVAPVVTVSCGVGTVFPTAESDPQELTRRADVGLYHAKQGGRNRVATGTQDDAGVRA